MAQEPIWPGSGSAASGSTPFGFYDLESDFQTDAPKFASWCAKRLGYPITAVELQDTQFYACLEESISEYSAQVNQFNIKDNLLSLKGNSTGSNLTHKRIKRTMSEQVYITEQYGNEASVGGTTPVYRDYITLTSGSQDYDLNELLVDGNEVSGSGPIEVKRVFYKSIPAISRYFDPYAGTGQQTNNMLDAFGFGGSSPAITFVLQPIYADLLRVQAIELNDQIRKSSYTFEIVNNKLRIFPTYENSTPGKLWIEWIKTEDRDNALGTRYSGSTDVISDYSNAPYDNMKYNNINDVGKQWIRKYGLALSKELLGIVRSKYGTIPIPNSEVSLDGDTLRAEATAEKDQLIEQLREMLDQTSNKALMEAERESSDSLQEQLKKVPYPIYIG
ncbi:MAG: hypothetical protein CMD25_07055 [Flavobacteriales bacterium]|nr:hypothetical protein [Flavobacteriales bacterium]|tara:strand:- start:52 stop:1218 length:1167 start_codon:yes stop_codon:yes gene_type:complete